MRVRVRGEVLLFGIFTFQPSIFRHSYFSIFIFSTFLLSIFFLATFLVSILLAFDIFSFYIFTFGFIRGNRFYIISFSIFLKCSTTSRDCNDI